MIAGLGLALFGVIFPEIIWLTINRNKMSIWRKNAITILQK